MKPEVVIRRIEAFQQRFGEAHLYFAYHAAFPLALTPDLLYRLWANFQRDRNGEALKIPWLAVADLLLSSLCDEVGYELYEMETEVRNALLRKLKANSRFGEKRIHELSDFLLVYVKQQLESHDPDMRDFAQVQTWTALAYTKPGEAAREIASTLAKLKLEEKAEWIRMASVVETFAEPLADFQPLVIYSREMANFVRGKTIKVVTELSQVARQGDKLKIEGVNLSIPKSLIRQIEENSESTQHFGDCLGFDSVPEEAAQVQSPPQKIQILSANPKDTSRLRLDQEVRDIKEGLQRAKKRDQFVLESQLAVRPRDIQLAMLDINPSIVHFSGHGTEEVRDIKERLRLSQLKPVIYKKNIPVQQVISKPADKRTDLTPGQRRRISQELESLKKEYDLFSDILKHLSRDLAIKASTGVQFLEQQIEQAEAEIEQLAQKIENLENKLQ